MPAWVLATNAITSDVESQDSNCRKRQETTITLLLSNMHIDYKSYIILFIVCSVI